jgi:hypothetical protein
MVVFIFSLICLFAPNPRLHWSPVNGPEEFFMKVSFERGFFGLGDIVQIE